MNPRPNRQTICGITLGETYKDPITGLVGQAHSYAFQITGCDRVVLQPPFDEDKKDLPKAYSVDANYLEDLDGNPVWNPANNAPPPEVEEAGEEEFPAGVAPARMTGGPATYAPRD